MADLGALPADGQINLAEQPEFDLGGMSVRPAGLTIEMNGEIRELQPRVMQVLIALAQARPAVMSRERLSERCWEGRIVGDDALNRCIVALRHLAEEFTPEPFRIETVPRVGYVLREDPASAVVKTASQGGLGKRAVLAIFIALVVIATTLAFSWARLARSAEPASIAVLPFRNLSSGDPYFAEGVGEEIMGQLAREPAFRVAGSASAAQFSGPSDPKKVGQALDVDYILEGSIRPDGDRLRINAALIRTKDGRRLWSETYDRSLDDILEVQAAIGEAVASGLRRNLIHSAAGSRRVNGEAYALYLNARGLLRSKNPESGRDAIRLLQQAIKADPRFAQAWSSFADALLLNATAEGNEQLIAAIPRAQRAARHALQLNPNLAEAHAVLSESLGFDSPEAIVHLRQAGELAERSGEGQLWRAGALAASGRFEEALAARHRAHDLDPMWPIPWRAILDDSALLGDRPAAEDAIREGFSDDAMIRNFALARVAWFSGDFSEAATLWAGTPAGSRWASPSKLSLENALFMLELSKTPPSRPARPSIGQGRAIPARIWMTAAPSTIEWRRRNRSSAAELVYRDENVIASKLMIRAGRAKELVGTFDGPTGLLGVRQGQSIGTCYLQNAALVVVALRAVGRNADADSILRRADAAIRGAYRRGKVPLWFEEDAAGIWALQGKSELASEALERALRRGSAHATRTDLPRLADEPALGPMRGIPRFEAIRAKYDAHLAKERRETAAALHLSAS